MNLCNYISEIGLATTGGKGRRNAQTERGGATSTSFSLLLTVQLGPYREHEHRGVPRQGWCGRTCWGRPEERARFLRRRKKTKKGAEEKEEEEEVRG